LVETTLRAVAGLLMFLNLPKHEALQFWRQ